MIFALELFGLILLTDFLTGMVHWWEDVYGNENWMFLVESVVKPNNQHHNDPDAFLKHSFIERIRFSVFVSIILFIICYLIGFLNWQVIFVLCYGSLANQLHYYSHLSRPFILIRCLQLFGLVQHKSEHDLHHTFPYKENYCVMTDYVNLILEPLNFWRRLERLVSYIFGINPVVK